MYDTILQIGVIQNALKPVGFSHLILMHQRFMRPAQGRRHVQSNRLQLRLLRSKASPPTRTACHTAEPRCASSPIARTCARLRGRLEPRLSQVPSPRNRSRSNRGPGCTSSGSAGCSPANRMRLRGRCGCVGTTACLRCRTSRRRNNGGKTKGQDNQDGNRVRSSHRWGHSRSVVKNAEPF